MLHSFFVSRGAARKIVHVSRKDILSIEIPAAPFWCSLCVTLFLFSSPYAVGVGGGEFWPFWNKTLQRAAEIDGKVFSNRLVGTALTRLSFSHNSLRQASSFGLTKLLMPTPRGSPPPHLPLRGEGLVCSLNTKSEFEGR